VRRGSLVPWFVAVSSVVLAFPSTLWCDEVDPPRDVDAWHQVFKEAVGGPFVEEPHVGWDLGIYPSVGVALGPPDWIAYQLHGYLSLSRGGHFSLFVGYGYEQGFNSKTQMATLGWGGVRRLTAGRDQRGFYGKFLRYRRLEMEDHGLHHGISVGTEHGAGAFGVAIEFGAARSSNNHWAFTAQVGLKLVLPMIVPLSRTSGTSPG